MIEIILLVAVLLIGTQVLLIFYLIKANLDQRDLIHRLVNEVKKITIQFNSE